MILYVFLYFVANKLSLSLSLLLSFTVGRAFPFKPFSRVLQKALRNRPDTVRTPAGSVESGISARPARNLLQCHCDAVLRFAIYSRISFCITWSDIIFLTFPCSSCTWQNEGTEQLYSTQLNSTSNYWRRWLTPQCRHLSSQYYITDYNMLISWTDLSPIPVRSTVKSYLTTWCI